MMSLIALVLAAQSPVVPVTVSVPATAETAAVTSPNDAADDPAIWRDKRDPARSLIVATDKKEGLNVYALDGRLRFNLPAGRVNNVDLRTVGKRVIVGASDRTDPGAGKLALFVLDTDKATLSALGRFPVDLAESYGFCFYQPKRGPLYAFTVGKDGGIVQSAIDLSGPTPQVAIIRRMKLATQSEGCVADDRTGLLYVAEEDIGLWRFDASPGGSVEPTSVAKVDATTLVADAEGLALDKRRRRGGHLIVSSQGDSAYTVYRLRDHGYVGRFRIAGGAIDGTSDTDGIELVRGSFGPRYPKGLFVAQDGNNAPDAQNFKLVSWANIQRALKK